VYRLEAESKILSSESGSEFDLRRVMQEERSVFCEVKLWVIVRKMFV
jgi:hypothetical protein